MEDVDIDTEWLQRFCQVFGRFKYPLDDPQSVNAAVKRADLHCVRHLVSAGADTTITDAKGRTPLMNAHYARIHDVAYYLSWEHNALVQALGQRLDRAPTQMEIYAVTTHKKMSRFRSSVRLRMESTHHKVLTAVRNDDVGVVRSMIEGGEISIDAAHKVVGHTLLSVALAAGSRLVCFYLLENGAHTHASCTIKNRTQSTLVAAVLTGDVGLVRRVVDGGAKLRTPEYDATTCALAEAAKLGSIEMVELLLDLGARYERLKLGLSLPVVIQNPLYDCFISTPEDTNSWMLLLTACWLQDKHLFDHVLSTHDVLRDLTTHPHLAAIVLFSAVYRENDASIAGLLARGASVNTDIGNGVTAIVAAVIVNSTRLLQFLIAQGADITRTSSGLVGYQSRDEPLLAVAVHYDAKECALELVALESRPRHKELALLEAIKRANHDIASRLMEDTQPATESSFVMCVTNATCPVMLDLLLSTCCAETYPIALLAPTFVSICHQQVVDTGLLAVYLAHGLDITHELMDGFDTATRLMDAVINRHGSIPRVKTLKQIDSRVPGL